MLCAGGTVYLFEEPVLQAENRIITSPKTRIIERIKQEYSSVSDHKKTATSGVPKIAVVNIMR
jgi:hypothetical protein